VAKITWSPAAAAADVSKDTYESLCPSGLSSTIRIRRGRIISNEHRLLLKAHEVGIKERGVLFMMKTQTAPNIAGDVIFV
jgi:hypothetical protein